MEKQEPENIKHDRAQELMELGNKLEASFVKSTENTVQAVLFETRSGDLAEGYTQHYVRVFADAQPGEIKDVLITHTRDKRAYAVPYIPGGR